MRKHKTTKVQKTWEQSLCAQPGCRFEGEPAVQGVCYSNEGEMLEWAKIARHEAEVVASMKAMRRREGKHYVRALEAHYVSAMLNWDVTLDECIRLRRDNALLKAKREAARRGKRK